MENVLRKWLCGGLYFMTAICIGLSAIFQFIGKPNESEGADCDSEEGTLLLVAKIFTFIGRASAGCVFAVLYIYTGELFPTGMTHTV